MLIGSAFRIPGISSTSIVYLSVFENGTSSVTKYSFAMKYAGLERLWYSQTR